jgi:hypothetical protein
MVADARHTKIARRPLLGRRRRMRFGGPGGLLFRHDFVKLVKHSLISGEVERLVSDFKQIKEVMLFVSLHELKRRQLMPPHIFPCDAHLKISDMIESSRLHLYASIQLSQSPASSASNISST